MHPILIDLGFFALPSYGLLLAIAVLAALWTLRRRADRAGLDGTRIVDLALWVVIWALVGSKALLIIVELPRYLRNPADLIGVVRAGGVFLGGFIGALIAAAVLLRRSRLAALPTFDVMVPSLALGQAIGRLGCLAAGCCWGRACDLPWAITHEDPKAAELLGTPLHVAVHPFPIYESLVDLALYGLLAALYRLRTLAPGRVFATYLGVYGGARFLLEMTRGDAARGFVLGGLLSTSQTIAVAMVVVSVVLHLVVSRRRSS
jgi:phosphatidylglycerol:prolipoprotein diacylglycerol transferase